ncbi:MAG: S-layer homology domain-containing protein [Clostridia bacterium]|nr:S-layer homology domain-containing protein [Clostridia bacterium]
MKNLNKVFAMLLVVAMMMTSVVFADFSDVADDAAYAEAVNVGVALGLFTGYEDGTFQPEGNITRAEFAAMVVRALNQENQAKSAATASAVFPDVAADHWANGYINVASKRGIVNGYEDGTFRPENNVTFEEAVKMLVVAIGHEPDVGAAGYPLGYLSVADDYDITDDAMGVVGEAATRGLVAQLLLNTMDTPLMEQVGYGAWVNYQVNDGYNGTARETLLSKNHGVAKLKVVVESTSLLTESGANDEEYVTVTVDDAFDSKYEADLLDATRIYAGETNISELVGKKAIVYASYDPKTKDLVAVYVKADTTKTYEVTVSSADRDSVKCPSCDEDGHTDHDNENFKFYYYKTATDKKASFIDVSKDAKVYFNGVLKETANANAIIAELVKYYGEATFQITADNSKIYDTVFITNYKTLVVESVSAKRFRVSSKNAAGSITYYKEDGSVDATLVDATGAEMAWEDLKENDIISVVESGDSKKVIKAELLTATVAGKVTGVSQDSSEYVIAGETYAVDGINVDPGDIALGDEGTFYLDAMGNICYYDTTAELNTNYAVVVDVGTESKNLEKRTFVKMFTYDGQFGTMATASKVTLDGIANIPSKELAAVEVDDPDTVEEESDDIIIAATKTAADSEKLVAKYGDANYLFDDTNYDATDYRNGIIVPEVGEADDVAEFYAVKEIEAGDIITFKANAAGEITEIARANDAFAGAITAANKGIFSLFAADVDLKYNEKSETLSSEDFAAKLSITDKTVIMVANLEGSFSGISAKEEEDFTLFSAANIADEQKLDNAYIYNVNEDKEVGFIFVTTETDPVDAGAIMALVTGTRSASDDEGNQIWNLKVLQDGLEKDGDDALVTAADENFGLVASYAIVPVYNAAGEVRNVKKLAYFDQDNEAVVWGADVVNPEDADVDPVTDDIYYYYGTLEDRSKKNFEISDGSDKTFFSVSGDTNVYVYNNKVNSKYACSIESFDIVEFEDGQAYCNGDSVDVKVVAREVEGEIIDLIIYIY